jgi:hypothetical protein
MSQFPGGPSPYGPSPFDGGQAYRPMPRSPSKGGTRPMPQMPGGGMPMPGGPGKGGRGRISRGGGKGGRRPQGPMPMPMPQNPLGMGGGMGQPMPQNPLGENPRIGGGSLGGSYNTTFFDSSMGQPMPNYRPDLLQSGSPPAIPPISGGMSDPGRITADGPVPGAPYMQNMMKGMLGDNMRSGSFSGGMFGGGGGSRFDAGGQPMGGGFGMQGLNQMQQQMGAYGRMMGSPSQFMKRMPQAMRRMPMGGFSAGGITDLYPL